MNKKFLTLVILLLTTCSCSTSNKNIKPTATDKVEMAAPSLTPTKWNCYKTDDKIDDNGRRWEQSHVVCVIEKESTWSK